MRNLLLAAALLSAQAAAQTPARDPSNALTLPTPRTVRFTTDQGTWMSVDVSPDGSTLVFDLLGDLYTMPIAGGKATRIVGGTSIDAQPRFSPDGKWIVFTSDRSGVDATWIADASGKHPRLVTAGGSQPAWTPDGKFIVTGNRMVDVRGGSGVTLGGIGGDEGGGGRGGRGGGGGAGGGATATGATFTDDGRYIWFQAPNGQQAYRYDRLRGTTGYQTNVAGGAFRPMVSRDGKSLAYFTRFEAKPALVVRDLESGAERWVLIGTQPEAAGTTPGYGPLPGSAWLPDGKAIVTSYGGKLWRVDVPSGTTTAIPFTADVEQSLGALVKGSYKIGDSVTVREIREPALSPDGGRVAFTALGKVWTMDLADKTPRRLTTAANIVESSPVWTPDGRSVVYATWIDGDGGDILQVDASGGTPRNLTNAPALYTRINISRDGSRLVFARAPRRARTVMGTELGLELRWMGANGGAQHSITMVADVGAMPLGGYAHFTPDTSRVLYHDGAALVSVRWDGSDRRVVLAGATPQTVMSPDGSHVLSRAGRRRLMYMFERPQVTDSITIDPSAASPPVPVRRLTRVTADFPSWSRDGTRAVWSAGTTLHVYDVAQGDKATNDSIVAAQARAPSSDSSRRAPADSTAALPRGVPAYEAARYDVKISVAADKPSGVVVLRGARIISMKDREIIGNGDIVVSDNRITAVGARGTVTIPRGARIIDVAGKTIIPGFVDVHADMAEPSQVHRTINAPYLANLAFGVTTTRDVESATTDVFSYADRSATGELVGPRIFATGPAVLDSASTIRTPAEARDFIGPYASAWRSNTIRGDLNATRPDRQRFLTVSRDLGLTAVGVGAPDFRKSLSAIIDGYADHQHAFDIYPIYSDVAKLIAEAGTAYTPMFLGRIGGRTGLDYILATESPHNDAKLRRFYHHKDLDRLVRPRSTWNVAEEYAFDDVALGAARIAAAGGKVTVGTGGAVQGISYHWTMALLAKGGMPNHDILRAATINGADAIGVGAEIGSIEVGKLADLMVLDRNPLTDIRNTNSLRYVMKNGRLYDASTLDQVAPTVKKLDTPWWVQLEPVEGRR